MYQINSDAIFVADSHYSYKNQQLFALLEDLQKSPPSQIFLLGDIFDFLSGYSRYFIQIAQPIIDILNLLANRSKIYYFEGNHDFLLRPLFDQKITIFPKSIQPVIFAKDGKYTALSHGDIYFGLRYEIFSIVLRSKYLISLIDYIDKKIDYKIQKSISSQLSCKNICTKIEDFENIARKRTKRYIEDFPKVTTIIEGHFHQNRSFNIDGIRYINIKSLVCLE